MPGVGTGGFGVTNNAPFTQFPPFPVTAADNGLSVDPVTGRIVLGNDFFGPPTAALTSLREIPLNGNQIFITDLNTLMQINTGSLVMVDTVNSNRAEMSISNTTAFFGLEGDTGTGSAPELNLRDSAAGGNTSRLRQNTVDFEITTNNPAVRMLQLNTVQQRFGDIDGIVAGWHLSLDQTGFHDLRNDITGERVQLWDTGAGQVIAGDVSNQTTGLQELVDINAGEHGLTNTALNAFYSCNGVAGFTGTVTPVTSITVMGGIVTAVA